MPATGKLCLVGDFSAEVAREADVDSLDGPIAFRAHHFEVGICAEDVALAVNVELVGDAGPAALLVRHSDALQLNVLGQAGVVDHQVAHVGRLALVEAGAIASERLRHILD